MGLVQPGGEEALAGPNSSLPVPRKEVIKERAPGFPQQCGVRQEEETETREVWTKDRENFTTHGSEAVEHVAERLFCLCPQRSSNLVGLSPELPGLISQLTLF